jgi:uncharacterized damage-inducible protein DinB
MGSIRATLVHTAAAQYGYTQRLNGKEYAPADNPFNADAMRTLDVLVAAWGELNPQTRQALTGLGDGARRIEYTNRSFTPPQRIRATAAGVAAQLLFHEVHHRAQVPAMLRQLGGAAQDLDYGALMFETDRLNRAARPRVCGWRPKSRGHARFDVTATATVAGPLAPTTPPPRPARSRTSNRVLGR